MGKAAASKRTTSAASDPAEQYLAALEVKQRFIGSVLNMGWRLAVTFLVPVAVGAWLDSRYATSPSYTITGLFVAIFGSVLVVKDTVKSVNEEMAAEAKLAKKPAKKSSRKANDVRSA